MQVRGKLTKSQEASYAIFGLLGFVTLWCVLTYGGFIKPMFLPSPTEVWRGLSHFNDLGWLFPAIWRSTVRVAVALLLVVVVATPIGVLMGSFSPLNAMLSKLFDAFKAVPPTGLVPLIILWFSIEEKAKIVFLFLGAVFYMTLLVRNAVHAVREDFLDVARDFGMKPGATLWNVLIPGALPQIWEAIIVANSIMWTYIVLAEFINSNEEQIGLGYLLQIGSRTFQPGQVYGTLILIGFIAFATDWLLKYVQRSFFKWSEAN